MGRPPRTVRGYFLDHPGAVCEPCLRAVPGMRGAERVRADLEALEREGLIAKGAGRCGTCRKNEAVWWRKGGPEGP